MNRFAFAGGIRIIQCYDFIVKTLYLKQPPVVSTEIHVVSKTLIRTGIQERKQLASAPITHEYSEGQNGLYSIFDSFPRVLSSLPKKYISLCSESSKSCSKTSCLVGRR